MAAGLRRGFGASARRSSAEETESSSDEEESLAGEGRLRGDGFFGDGRTCARCSTGALGSTFQTSLCTDRTDAAVEHCTVCQPDEQATQECSYSRDRVCARRKRGCTQSTAANFDAEAVVDCAAMGRYAKTAVHTEACAETVRVGFAKSLTRHLILLAVADMGAPGRRHQEHPASLAAAFCRQGSGGGGGGAAHLKG